MSTSAASVQAVPRPVRRESVARGAALSLVGGFVAGIGGLVLTIVVDRGLGPERAGVFFISIGLFTILSNTLELGADTGLVRSVPRLRSLGRTAELRSMLLLALVPVVVIGLLAAALVFVFAPTLAHVFMEQGSSVRGTSFLRSIAPFLLFAPLATVLVAGTRGFGSVVPFVSIQNIAMPLARPLGIGALVAFGVADDRAVGVAWGVPWLIAAVVAGLIVRRQLRQALLADAEGQPLRPVGEIASEFWRFASTRAFAGAAEITLIWLDVLLVGWLVGPLQSGVYATASRFVTTGTLALSAARLAMSPRLSTLLTEGRSEEVERLNNGGTRAVVASSWPLYLGLACFSPVLLRLFGHGFSQGATALTILSLAMLVDTATGNISTVLLMGGQSRWNLVNAAAALAVDVVLDLILIPHHGATGAAIGWAAGIVTMNVLACIEVHSTMHLRIVDAAIVRTAAVCAGCFGVTGLVLGQVVGQTVVSLAVWLVVGGAVYLGWWWTQRNDPEVLAALHGLRSSR